jgi:hypothetical protein
MYIPSAFEEKDRGKLFDFLEAYSFGLHGGEPFASHLPFLLERGWGPHGALLGHMARANPQWHDLDVKEVLDALRFRCAAGTVKSVTTFHPFMGPPWVLAAFSREPAFRHRGPLCPPIPSSRRTNVRMARHARQMSAVADTPDKCLNAATRETNVRSRRTNV